MDNKQEIWDEAKKYGEIFYQRATGQLPEMESSKAVAKILRDIINDNDTLVDMGCGGGHYLLSIAKNINKNFDYIGLDRTANYLELAKRAWENKQGFNNINSIRFQQGNIYDIPLEANTADVVVCNNVLLHLPSVEKPINELIRVSRKYVLIRTLVGRTSFRIQQVNPEEKYDSEGEPVNYNYHNIYSEDYIRGMISQIGNFKDVKIWLDNDYDADGINNAVHIYDDIDNRHKATTVVNGMQTNNYIIQPWSFILIEK